MQASELAQQYGYFFDRTLGGKLDLPYKLENIQVPINEISYSSTINEVYEKLQDNLIYIYSLTKLADNNIPFDYAKIASGTPSAFYPVSGSFLWISTATTNTNISKPLSSYGLPQLDNLKDGKFTFKKPIGTENRIGFFVSSTHIYALTSDYDKNTIGVYISSNSVTENSLFTYGQLNSIAVDETKNYLYVSDTLNNTIYQYDISNLVAEDNIIGRKLIYQDSVGGLGTYLDVDKFNGPCYLNVYNSDLYLVDRNNYCIKVYDSNLNWKKTFRNRKLFLENEVTSFRINLHNDRFYLGFKDKLGVFSVTNELSTVNFFSMSSFFETNEKIVDFSFSEVDKNIFYVVTNKNIFKKFISKPETNIGKFKLGDNNVNTTEFVFSYIENYDNVRDNFTVYGKRYNVGMFLSFLEKSNYTTILTNNDLDFYTIEEIRVNPEEYSQDWVFSKANYKILLNILAMRDRITKRFAGKYDSGGNNLFFGTLYLLDEEVQKDLFDYSLNYLVGINEMYSNAVLNRSINKFYDLQMQMLSVLKDTTINTWPPLSTTKIIT